MSPPSPLSTSSVSTTSTSASATVNFYDTIFNDEPNTELHQVESREGIAVLASSNSEPESSCIAVADRSGGIYVIKHKLSPHDNLSNFATASLCLNPTENVTHLRINDTGTELVAATASTATRLINVTSGKVKALKAPFRVHTSALLEDPLTRQSVQVVAGADRALTAIDCVSGRQVRRFVGHRGAVRLVEGVAGCHFVSASVDRTLMLWDVRVQYNVAVMDLPVGCKVAVEPGLKSYIVISDPASSVVRMHNVATLKQCGEWNLEFPATALALGGYKSRMLAVGGAQGQLSLMDLARGKKGDLLATPTELDKVKDLAWFGNDQIAVLVGDKLHTMTIH